MSEGLFAASMHGLIRLFYPSMPVSHRERLPAHGPAIVVANHPNGLLDPLVLRVALGLPLRFLGKSTFWGSPVTRFAMNQLRVLPAYRAHEADARKNEETFAQCRDHLREGGWLALFPEGKSHSETTLQPLKTGAARIALSAVAEGVTDLKLVPVGLLYADKAVFRTSAGVVVGEPLRARDWAEAYAADPRAAAQALTERLAAALGEVVLQANDAELLRGLNAVAAWTAADGGRDEAARDRRALALAATARRLAVEAPDHLDAAVMETRRFVEVMDTLGVDDPFSVEAPKRARLVTGGLKLLALAPFALVGAMLAWVPYRAVRPLAARLAAGESDVVGTYKLVLGLVALGLVYLGWALVAGWLWGPLAALAALVVGPLTGLAAVRFDDRLTTRARALKGWWRSRDADAVAAVHAARRALCAAVEAAVDDCDDVG